MIAAALLLLAAAHSAVEAERDFAALAQTKGQWTAFRAYAAPEGIMFVPSAANAQGWLRDQKDPPVPVMWWPGRSWVSCDGSIAVNTGPWVRRGGQATGTFTTVWKRGDSGDWKWLLDSGNNTPKLTPAGDKPQVEHASCHDLRSAKRKQVSSDVDAEVLMIADDVIPARRRARLSAQDGDGIASGASTDGSLRWEARALKGAEEGAHVLRIWLWDGRRYALALLQVSGVKVE